MTYEQAKAERDRLESEVKAAGEALKPFPANSMGITPDYAKTTEWHAAKRAFGRAFENLRKFNAMFVKTFKKEIMAERRAKYTGTNLSNK